MWKLSIYKRMINSLEIWKLLVYIRIINTLSMGK